MNRIILKTMPLALTLALGAGVAHAGDDEGYHGYFRVGAGSSSTHGPQSCYGLGGNTMKYRLGNECDSYGEFGYTKEFAKSEGVSFVGTLWTNVYSPNSEFSGAKLELLKAYVEAKGIPALNGGSAWVGKRFYYRPDIHMLDLQYINLNGTGGGLDQIGAGPGTFSYAVFKDNDRNVIDPATGMVSNTSAALRQNLLYQGLPVNPDGTVDVATSLIKAEGNGKHNGWQISAFHRQQKVMGGANVFGLQYGVGPGTGIGVGNDRIGASGDTSLGSDVKRLRVFDDVWIQPSEHMGMELVALVQRDRSDAGGSSTWTTLGARPVYAFNKHVKLVTELGVDHVSFSNGTPGQRLTKLTIAPTLSSGPGLWDRPELRTYVTYGKWNDGARAAVNAANNSGPVYNGGNSGVSVGVQAEIWF